MTKLFAPRTPRGRIPSGKSAVVKKRGRNVFGKAGKAVGRKHGADFNLDRYDRVEKVLARAAEDGLLAGKETRVAGRVSPELVERAKRQTGIQSNTELLEFALANVALEDNFAEVFRELEGTVNPALELGY